MGSFSGGLLCFTPAFLHLGLPWNKSVKLFSLMLPRVSDPFFSIRSYFYGFLRRTQYKTPKVDTTLEVDENFSQSGEDPTRCSPSLAVYLLLHFSTEAQSNNNQKPTPPTRRLNPFQHFFKNSKHITQPWAARESKRRTSKSPSTSKLIWIDVFNN